MLKKAIVVVVNVAVIGGFYWVSARGARQVTVDASLEADVIDLGFQAGGRIAELLAHEGQQVRVGQVLGSLDVTELAERERNAGTRLASAESQIPQIETAIQLQRQTSFADVQEAEAALAAARAHLDEVRHGARPQEIEQARQAHLAAQTRLENARVNLSRARDLYAAGSQPKKAVDDAQTAFDLAQADERRAQESLGLVTEGARPESVAAAEAQVRQVEAQLSRARGSQMLVTKLEQQMVTARSEVESARAAYQEASTQRGYSKLISPANAWVLTAEAHAGEVVGVGSKVFTLSNLDALWTQVYVDERDALRLKQGQKVTITAETLPGRRFEGQIAAIYFQTRKDQIQRSCRIRTAVKNEDGVLKPGMRVKTVFPF